MGLYKEKPWITAFLCILLMSLAGIPPTAGFLAKYQVFALSIGQGILWISLFAIVMAIIGVYYYFNVIREVFTARMHSNPLIVSKMNLVLIIVCSVAVVVMGVFVWNLKI